MPDHMFFYVFVNTTDVSVVASALLGVKLPIHVNGVNVSTIAPDFYGNDFPRISVYVDTSEVGG